MEIDAPKREQATEVEPQYEAGGMEVEHQHLAEVMTMEAEEQHSVEDLEMDVEPQGPRANSKACMALMYISIVPFVVTPKYINNFAMPHILLIEKK